MAMAPTLRYGSRILSSFITGLGGVNHGRSSVVQRSRGSLLVACRGQFSATAYRKSNAAEWEEAAEVYFSKQSSGGTDSAEKTESANPGENADKISKGRRSFRLENGRGGKSKHIKSRMASTRTQKRKVDDDDTEAGWGAKVKADDQFDDEEFDEASEFEKESSKPQLPVGMRRLKRGYGRNGTRSYYDPREENDRPSEVPPLQGEPLYGVGPVRAALQSRRRDLYVLYVQEGLDEKRAGKRKAPADVVWILRNAKKLELKTEVASKHVLNMLVDSRPHQGLVLDASPLEMVDISALDNPGKVHSKAPVWVALDEVKDPQNFGAILRTAYFFGVTGVVVCAKNSAPLSGVVSKASAGALEMIDLLSCKNMMMFLRDSSDNGWRVIGTSNSTDSVVLGDVPKNLPTILVLGNEGVGIRPFVKAACHQMVRIPGAFTLKKPRRSVEEEKKEAGDSGDSEVEDPSVQFKAEIRNELQKLNAEVNCFLRPGTVDSLNVSVAAGILLNELINFTPKSELLSK